VLSELKPKWVGLWRRTAITLLITRRPLNLQRTRHLLKEPRTAEKLTAKYGENYKSSYEVARSILNLIQTDSDIDLSNIKEKDYFYYRRSYTRGGIWVKR
jgi:hypothetical protein